MNRVRLTAAFRSDQVRRYVEAVCLDASERMATVLIPHARDRGVVERFTGAAWLLRDSVLRFLAAQNAAGFGVYMTPNPLADGARRRSKETTRHVSSVWLDLDRDAEAAIERLTRRMPPPTTIVRTSRGKYQVLWRVAAPIDVDAGERILRGLAVAYGGDRAATDACRLLRLPGFVNTKYPALPLSRRIVEVVGGTGAAVEYDELVGCARLADAIEAGEAPTRVRAVAAQLQPADEIGDEAAIEAPPAEIVGEPELVRLWRGQGWTTWPDEKTASERDLALGHGLRRRDVGVERAAQILRSSPNRRSGRTKHNLNRYLGVTLARAGYALPLA